MIELSDAKDIILQQVIKKSPEEVSILDSLNHVLAEDIFADRDYPPFNRATMDGFALQSKNYSENRDYKIIDTVFAGDSFDKPLSDSECVKIMTGAAVPDGLDAVIRIEDSQISGSTVRFSVSELKSGKNVAQRGEDCKAGVKLLNKDYLIKSTSISLLATVGCEMLKVYPSPTVSLITTGNEIIPLDQHPGPHQIRNSNSYAIKALLKDIGIKPSYENHVSDNIELLRDSLSRGLHSDILIITGGVSMGDSDHVPGTLSALGVEKLFHKVKIKPGKPIWFGVKEKTAVFALPGNPMSCQICFKVFIEPYIRGLKGIAAHDNPFLPLSQERQNRTGRNDCFPVQIEKANSFMTTLDYNGSGDIKGNLHSDGFAIQPHDLITVSKGELLEYIPWRAYD
ncbi:MAG: molybdopterin molybdotransferase MoeA [Spirochaetota bacterium]|nr:molybdopterin molybdotransferase MoeA [Spirochaetota bacterium]